MEPITWLVIGLLAGWLAGLVMKGSGYGLVGDILVGLLGGVVGAWLFVFIVPNDARTGFFGSRSLPSSAPRSSWVLRDSSRAERCGRSVAELFASEVALIGAVLAVLPSRAWGSFMTSV